MSILVVSDKVLKLEWFVWRGSYRFTYYPIKLMFLMLANNTQQRSRVELLDRDMFLCMGSTLEIFYQQLFSSSTVQWNQNMLKKRQKISINTKVLFQLVFWFF